MLNSRKNKKLARNGLITALDIGTTKIVAFIARPSGTSAEIIGIGHRISKGVRSGNIVDMDAIEACVVAAVEEWEAAQGSIRSKRREANYMTTRLWPGSWPTCGLTGNAY